MNADLFGFAQPVAQFRDIRNTRPSVAEQKAELCLRLSQMCRKVPPSICSADIKTTRNFVHHLGAAKKILAKKSASVQELQTAISQLESFK